MPETTPPARLWLCLHFPQLALEISRWGYPKSTPIALIESSGARARLLMVDAIAYRRGLRAGQGLTAARTGVPGLRAIPYRPAAEHEALVRLACWAYGYSPIVDPIAPRTLVVEIGASVAVFGGLNPLRRRLQQDLRALGHQARLAVAPTPLGAEWLARAGTGRWLTTSAALGEALRRLPVTVALAGDAEFASKFGALGLRTLGDLCRLPRDGMARRFGPELLDRLDRALGRRADTRAVFRSPDRFRASADLPAPVEEASRLAFVCRRLFTALAVMLRTRQQGIPGFELRLAHERSEASCLQMRLYHPSRDPEHWLLLLRERLHRLELRDPVTAVTLVAEQFLPLADTTADLFDAVVPAHATLALLERLQSRLGKAAVRALGTRADHRPERALCLLPPERTAGANETPLAPRPHWLVHPPVALDGSPPGDWTLSGPERIESGWWDGRDVSRDYYIAECPDGRRLWIYRQRRAPYAWYVHGIFG